MLESDVARQLRDFLAVRGWRCVRTQFAHTPGVFSTGEPGMADYLFLRYLDGGQAYALWIEVKGPNDRRKCKCEPGSKKVCGVCRQRNWQEREKQRGGRVTVVSDFQRFAEQYERAYGFLHRGEAARGQLELL